MKQTSRVQVKQISPNTDDVLKLIRALDQAVFSLYPKESCFVDSPEQLISDGAFFLGAYLENKLVGIGAIKLQPHYAELKRMYTDPTYRRSGIANAILFALESYIKRSGIPVVCLETGIRQTEAISFYKKHGFVERPPFGNYRSDPWCLFMEKTLAENRD